MMGARAGLAAGLRVEQAYGVFFLPVPGVGLAVPASLAPGHPTSICDIGVKCLQKLMVLAL